MGEAMDSKSRKSLVKHIVNNTLCELCLVCLDPLEENFFESIFTLICKAGEEYCVANALEAVCQFKLAKTENYNICLECFSAASQAYKFHLQAKRSMELITHYTEELIDNVKHVEITEQDMEKLLCIPLTEYSPATRLFDFNLNGIGIMNFADNNAEKYLTIKEHSTDDDDAEKSDVKDDDDILIVVQKDESDNKTTEDLLKSNQSSEEDDELFMIVNEKKTRKKRDPMAYMTCSQCPVKYRFVAKLKEHMKTAHDIELYYCKICKMTTENQADYERHLKQHTGKHQCNICNIVYKRPETLVAHKKTHDKRTELTTEQLENANICELCGTVVTDSAELESHMRTRHMKRYTCFYCGRRYRGEGSFEAHVRRHEDYWRRREGSKPDQTDKQADKSTKDKSTRSVCQTCGKDFVDERSLLWHQRLHNNDRPYSCEVCGRRFVTVNRRNQHALCAHTPPQRRCPLCPALFHLRSMVNTHVKKVHLKEHKRRNRTSKHQNVFWRTQPVPIQELSIDVQNDVMELQAAQGSQEIQAAQNSEIMPPGSLNSTNMLFI